MGILKRWKEKSGQKRFDKFLNEYKSFSDELLWKYYCGLDMDNICGESTKYARKMYSLVEDELEKRNNPKYPIRSF